MDNEHRDWLLSLSEFEASNLPREDWYDRIRLIRVNLGTERLERIKRESVAPLSEKTSPRAYNEPTDRFK